MERRQGDAAASLLRSDVASFERGPCHSHICRVSPWHNGMKASVSEPIKVVENYLQKKYRIVVWPQIGDTKGPREKEWTQKVYSMSDYSPGYRVGLMTGVEVEPGKFLHDVDIDYQPAAIAALKMLPPTGFVFGRSSKRISHCFYLCTEALPSFKYEDIDKTSLIELRGTKVDGSLGLQTMVPPSIWSKENQREELVFVKQEEPAIVDGLQQRVCLSAVAMLLAKHFGHNGFGHEPRMAWAGYFLRLGIPVEELVVMGEAISACTNNLEVADVRRVVESTHNRLQGDGKVKGGPQLAKILGKNGRAVLARINEWLGRDSDFIRSNDGLIIKDNQENIKRALSLLDIELSYNEFADRMLVKDVDGIKVLDDSFVSAVWLRIDREFRFRPSYQFFERVVFDMAWANDFHPVRDYLDGLKDKWDGVSRVNEWLVRYAGAKNTRYVLAVSAIVLIAAVRRVREPGCKYDEMLVLESSQQGLNKSSALRALCPQDDWFSDDLPLNVEAKQVIERTLGKWIIEASDMKGNRAADRDHLKAMLSRQVDGPARMAYARIPVERRRQFVIIGTTNNAEYLNDPTGARRFWPIEIQKFDVEAVKRDREQLWAEACAREAAGESIRLSEDLWDEAGQEQEARQEVDPWEHLIIEHLPLLKPACGGERIQVTSNKLFEVVGLSVAMRGRMEAMRISNIMQRLGFRRTKIRVDNVVQAGYVRESWKLPLDESEK